MNPRLLEAIFPSAKIKVLDALQRSEHGLAVTELADRLKMSYTGMKDVCAALEESGLVVTWRQPSKLGRPQLLYRIAPKARELFPTENCALLADLLTSAQKMFGLTAAEKLLVVTFQARAEEYKRQITGETLEKRARAFARLRDKQGCMAEFEKGPGAGQFRIVEYHEPLAELLNAYPILRKIETDLYRRVLGVAVHREEICSPGISRVIYTVIPETESPG